LFRITQSFLVNSFAEYLRANGWQILYEDYVDGRRSGKGSQGVVNHCFKGIFDQFPDIVAIKQRTMLVIEVDLSYKHSYVKKLTNFKSKQNELLSCIIEGMHLDLAALKVGMVFLLKPNVSQARELCGIHIWLYNKIGNRFLPYQADFSTLCGG
jgi:hypothetical protein